MFKAGDKVKLKEDCEAIGGMPHHDNKEATITRLLDEVEGGVFLDDGLRGCRYWNIKDLEHVK